MFTLNYQNKIKTSDSYLKYDGVCRAPLNYAVSSQRGLKHAYARRALKLMALAMSTTTQMGALGSARRGIQVSPPSFVVTF